MEIRSPSDSEVCMAHLECPKCGTKFKSGEGWANVAVATLIEAPAVPDMATQMRCPQCQHVFAENEIRYQRSSGLGAWAAALGLLGIGFLIWTIYQLYWT